MHSAGPRRDCPFSTRIINYLCYPSVRPESPELSTSGDFSCLNMGHLQNGSFALGFPLKPCKTAPCTKSRAVGPCVGITRQPSEDCDRQLSRLRYCSMAGTWRCTKKKTKRNLHDASHSFVAPGFRWYVGVLPAEGLTSTPEKDIMLDELQMCFSPKQSEGFPLS